MILLLAVVAFAGWTRLPTAPSGVEAVLEPRVGDGVLFRTVPEGVPVRVSDGGVPVPLRAGPDGTWWIPPSDRTRRLVVTTSVPVRLERWEETAAGEARRWTSFARAVARWCRIGGRLPEAPGDLDGLAVRWESRREALRATGEEDPRLCTAAAWLELEGVRVRSRTDHVWTDRVTGEVASGGTFRADVRGPGVFVVDVKARIRVDDPRAAVRLTARLDGIAVDRMDRTAGEDPDTPGLSYVRRLEIVVPPGPHRVALDVLGDPVVVSARMERMRLPLGRFGLYRGLDVGRGPLGALEAAATLGHLDVADLAEPLMEGPAADLARARYIASHPVGDVVLARVDDSLGPVSRAAWARRVRILGDVPAEVLVGMPDDWLFVADDVAAVLREVDPSAVRPRDVVALRMADEHVVSTGTVRWVALEPEGAFTRRRVPGALGGRTWVRLEAGRAARVAIPDLRDGLGHLRLQADTATRYRVGGAPRYGRGRLDEALPSGEVEVLVDEGTLWLLDDPLVTGGERVQEVPVAALPAEWVVPEPGFPVRLAITPLDPGVELVVHTGDGRVWPVTTGETPTTIDVTPITGRLRIEGPPSVRVAVAMQRAIPAHPPALPVVKGEPLARIREISTRLVVAPPEDPVEIAALRLERAAAEVALGLTGTARRELNAVAAIPGVTPAQRALAATPLPPPLRATDPGPLTAEAALAVVGRLPPEEDSGDAWWAAAEGLPPALRDVVLARAVVRHAAGGHPYRAVAAGEGGGVRTRAAVSRVVRGGRWRRIRRVEGHGGVVREVVEREPPGEADTIAARVREALLGAPWDPRTYTVLRGGRRDRLAIRGPGRLDVHLLCRDEALSPEPEACRVDVVVDEASHPVKVDEGTLRTVPLDLAPGEHEIVIHPRRKGVNAVVVRVERDGVAVPPQRHINAHVVGSGVRTVVAGPTLVRVRVLRGGPVTVDAGGRRLSVEDEAIVPVLEAGTSPVAVDGPAGAWVDLALWEPLAPELAPPPLPEPVSYVAPAAQGEIAEASRRWIGALRRVRRPDQAPPGAPGTLDLSAALRDDAVGARDAIRHYRVVDLQASGRIALPGRWWGRGTGRLRASPDGPVGIGASARAWWVRPRGWVEVGVRGFGTEGAGHVRLDGEVRRSLWTRDVWRVRGFVRGRAGWWSRAAPAASDPLVWNAYAADHPFGVILGSDVLWRPALDGRVRGTVQVVSNAGPSVDRIEAILRGDGIVRDELVVTPRAEIGLRLGDRDRARTIVRPVLGLDLAWSGWPGLSDRAVIEAGVRWLPLAGAAEGSIGVSWERSRRRGLLDHPPPEVLFGDLLDVPRTVPSGGGGW